MIVQCPNCDTKYNLEEAVLGSDGARVRCIRCSHVFFVAPPGGPNLEQEANQSDEEFDWLKEMDESGSAGNAGNAAGHDDDFLGQGGELPSKDSGISLEIQASEEPKNKVLTYVIAALVIAIIGLGAFLYSRPAMDLVSSWFGSAETEEAKEPEVLGPDEVQLISLQNVRQYFVTNEKIGQLFVIEGKARNDFSVPMELIKIEASLFDAQGQVVEQKEFLAGNTVSLFQLQILSEPELEAALQARVGILTNNTNLRPTMDVQFMVFFSNPPDTVQEYGLKVIEAQHPPQ